MREGYEHRSEDGEFEWSFDRDTLGTILLRHPWTVRFLAAELLLLSLAGIIPLFGESQMKYLLFGILVSLASVGAIAAFLIAMALTVRWGIREARYGGGIWPLQSRH